ncbi:MAG: hypothetical protein EOO07_23340 [Chitinophagaceae bacterium]|nr:MAG: hypothetical protein EOO07_23340 [Chitinophagaceae bacterium]
MIDQNLWNTLIEENKFIPHWDNVLAYFGNENKSNDLLTTYLNRADNYNALSEKKIGLTTGDSAEPVRKLSIFIMTNNMLSEQAYPLLIKSNPYSWTSLTIEGLRPTQVDAIMDRRSLALTKYNYDKLRAHFPDRHIRLLTDFFLNYQKTEEEIELGTNDYITLLDSVKITPKQKVELIAKMSPDVVTGKEIADRASNVLLNQKKQTAEFTLLKKLVQHNSSNSIDVALLLLNYKSLSREEVTTLLETMANGYKKLLVKRSRPNIPKTDNNKKLVELLKTDGYILSFKENKNEIKVTALYK